MKCKLNCCLLIKSTYTSIKDFYVICYRYVNTACNSLRLVLKNFATVIKSNIETPTQSVGVDISRQERQVNFLLLADVTVTRKFNDRRDFVSAGSISACRVTVNWCL